MVDVTLAAGGQHLQAHKVVLSACSEYFQSVFAANPCQHPVVILKDVAFEDLETVVKFMYHGIVNVPSDKLPGLRWEWDFLKTINLILNLILRGQNIPKGRSQVNSHESNKLC